MEWVLFLGLIALAWWMGSRTSAKNMPTPLAAKQAPSYEDYQDKLERGPPETLDGDELEIRRAIDTVERHRSEQEARYRERKAAIAADEAKLERARDFIESSNLGFAVPSVWEEIRHWPSWSKLEKGRWSAPIPVSEIAGSQISAKPEWTQFRAEGGSLFKIEFERSTSYGDDELEFATMRLFTDGEKVLEIGASRNWANEFERWRFSTVDCLKVGPWISEFVEFDCKLKAAKGEQSAEWHKEYISSRAANVDLGDKGT